MDYKDKVLVLTPVKDAEQFLDTYFKLLSELTYPHGLILLGILEEFISSSYAFQARN